MLVTRNRERIDEYIKYVQKEIDLMRTYLLPDRKVAKHHWGGGTPTHLKPEEIHKLASYINQSFEFTDNPENSCEIDPRELTKEHLEALRKNGFNRISMGVQDFNDQVQKAVNRIQPEDLTQNVVNWVRELKFQSINLDLIYGLPFQTVKSFSDTVEKIIDISPDRIAMFFIIDRRHTGPAVSRHMSVTGG